MKKLLHCTFYLLLFFLPVRSLAQLTLTPGTFSSFKTTTGTPSAAQTQGFIDVGFSGTGIDITPPAGFEISLDGTTYGSTAHLPPFIIASGGTIYLRLLAADPTGVYSGNVQINTDGVITNVAVPNSYVGPLIIAAGAPAGETTTYGTASAAQQFTIEGHVMQGGVLVTPPTGFEVSSGGAYGPTVTVGAAGDFAPQTVSIRLAANTPANTAGNPHYLGNIVLTSLNASTVNVVMPSSTVNQAPLTIAANTANKTYGTTLTGGAGSTAFTPTGLQNSETIGTVTLAYGSGSAATDAVGTYSNHVTPSLANGGSFTASNYIISYNPGDIVIAAAPLTIAANTANKTYGTALTGGAGSTAFTPTGLQNGETIGSVTIAYGSGAAATDAVGTYSNHATPSAATGGSFTASNYTISYNPGDIVIAAAPLTIAANTANKTYGTALTGGAGSTAFTPTGLQNGENIGSVTIAYGSGAAATDAVATYSGHATPSAAVGGTFTAANYSITYTPGDIVIGAAPLTITANTANKTYGTALTGGAGSTAFNPTGLQNGENIGSVTIAYGSGAAATDAVGTYSNKVTPSAATGGSFTAANYTITYTQGDIVIAAAPLTIAASTANKIYGTALTGGAGSAAFTPTGLQNGETIGSVTIAYGSGAAATDAVGTYTNQVTPSLATGGSFTASNYTISYNPGDIVIGAAPLTIAANTTNKTYGTTLTAGTGSTAFTPTGLQNGETIGSVTVAYGTGSLATDAVGTYSNQVTSSAATGGSFTATNYTITYTQGDIVIAAAPLTIAANTANKTYGTTLTGGAGSVAFTPTGLQNGETIGSVTIAYGSGAAATDAVGTYTNQVTPSLATGGSFTASNYTISYNPGDIVIGAAPLTIAANTTNKTYGTTLTAGTGSTAFTPTGLQNGETIGSVTVAYGTGSLATDAVGTYSNQVTSSAATGGSFTATNYTITYTQGDIVIAAAPLTIAANTANKTYGTALTGGAGSTAFTPTGLQNGENIGSVTIAYGSGAAATDAVATYSGHATPSAAVGGTFTAANYSITYTPGDIVIGAAPLTITANTANKTYGTALTGGAGSTAFNPTGLQNGENIGSVTIAYGSGAAATDAVGTYSNKVTPSAATGGSFTAANYTITYTQGDIVIAAAPLTIAASTANKIYGTALTGGAGSAAFTPTGLQNGETIGSVTIAYGSGAAATDAVGTYTNQVTPSLATGGSFTASNYTISYNPGDIVIGAAPLTIAANTTNKTYGTTLTAGTGSTAFTPTGLQNGETIGSVTVAYGTGSLATDAVGTYSNQVTSSAATGGSFTATNYTITYTQGDIVIAAAPLTIAANTANKTYGTTLTGGAGSVAFTPTGLQNGETIGSVTIAYGSGSAATDAVGTYSNHVTPSSARGGSFTASNYTITYAPGDIVIGAAPLTIAANTANKTYGTALTGGAGATTFTPTGLQNSETIGSVTIAYGSGAAATDAVGTYSNHATPSAAVGGTFTAANYSITYTAGDIVIAAAPLTIAANTANKTYGTALTGGAGSAAFTPTGLQNSETIGSVTIAYGSGAAATDAVGTYSNHAIPSLAAGGSFTASNYIISYNPGDIVIAAAPLTIAANTANKTYGTALTGGAGATTFTPTGLQNGENIGSVTIAYGSGSLATDAVGTYTNQVTPSVATGGSFTASNYTVTYTKGDIVIGAAPLTIAANTANKTYGTALTGGPGSTAFTPTGLQNGETIGSVTVAYGSGAAATDAVGTYSNHATPSLATGGSFTSSNYTITYASGDIVVGAAPLTIAANPANKTYGTALTGGAGSTAFTTTGLQNGENIGSVTIAYGSGAAATDAVGTYTNQVTPSVAIGGSFTASNYTITYTKGDIVIAAAPLTIAANTANKTYGATLTGGAGSAAFTPTGLQNGETIGSVTIAYGSGSAATDAVGTYSNHATPSLATGGSFTASNYIISYNPGDIVIAAAPLTIAANTANKTYGTALTGGAGSTAFTPTGLQNGETIGSVTVAYGTGSLATDAVGTYSNQVTPSAAAGGTFNVSNYSITYNTGDIVVAVAPLTITANTANKTYGGILTSGAGATAFTPAGLQNSETIGSVTLTYGSGSAATNVVGTYSGQATPSVAVGGTFTAANYSITYTPGDIVIGAAPLTIAANTANKTYGATLTGGAGSTAFTPTGLQNSETIGSVTLAYGSGSLATDAVGTYSNKVTPSAATGGSFTAANYTITYTQGDIVIAAAPLTIAASTANKIYGTALTGGAGSAAFTPTGLKNGETIGSVTIAYGSGAAATDAVGTYTNQVTPSLATGGSFTASNYTISYNPGDIVIGAAPLTIAANTTNKTYGTTLTAGTGSTAFTPTGLQNGETIGSVTVAYGTGSLATDAVGTYSNQVTSSAATGGSFTATNYTITYTNGDIVIAVAPLTIAANTANKTYGTALTGGAGSTAFTPTGLQNGENIGSVTLAYGSGSLATDAVGTYSNEVTPSAATGGSFTAANYTITYTQGDIVIAAAPLTIAANTANKTYGTTLTGGAGSVAFTPTGLKNGETIGSVTLAYGSGSAATDAVGTYSNHATPSLATGGSFTASNYTISYNPGDIVIAAAPLTITASDVSKTYGATITGAAGSSAFTPTGLQNAETIGSVTVAYGTGSLATDAVGTYANQVVPTAATGGTFTASNYTITYADGTITVGKANLTIAGNDVSKNYGSTLTGGAGSTAFTPTGLQNAETIGSVTIGYGVASGATTVVGVYPGQVNASAATGGTANLANYNVTYGDGIITVNAATLTIAANTANKTYGTALTGGTGSTAFTPTGLQNGETIGSVTIAYGSGSAATDGVGTYTNQVTPSLATGGSFTASNYTISYNPGDIVIAAAPLTIAANTANKTYGTTLTGGTGSTAFTPTGLKNGETIGSVTVAYGTGSLATDAVGTYSSQVTSSAATGGSFTATNYTITYTNGDIVIAAAPLTITANTANKTYGTVLTGGAGSTAFTPTGLQNSETIGSVSIAYGTGSAGTDAVGTYANQVTPSVATGGSFAASNYIITYTKGDIVIAAAPLTITANTANKTYGTTLTGGAGSTAFTPTGLQNGETIGSVTIAYGSGSAATDAVGTYTNQVTPSAATGGSFTASNYTVTYTKGDIVITAGPLTIAATTVNKTYGTALTSRSSSTGFTPTGLLNGETIGSVTLTYGTGSLATDGVGTYSNQVTPSAATGGTFTASNYTINYTNADIIIGTMPIAVTADVQTKVYGDVDPTLSYTITSGSLVGSDTFTGVLTRLSGENVGTYAISQGTLALSTNYNLSFTGNNLSITAKPITVIADTTGKYYGNADPASLTYHLTSSLVGSDTFTGALSRDPGENAGTYNINQNTLALSSNYLLTYGSSNFTIRQRPLTITANDAGKVYGQTLTSGAGSVAYAITSGSLLNTETIGSITMIYGTGSAATDAVGTYTGQAVPSLAAGGTFNPANYNISYVNGAINVTAAPLTITANGVSKVYGQTIAGASGSTAFTGSGLQNGDSIGTVTLTYGTGSAATDGVGIYNARAVPSAATGGTFDPANYTITYTGGDITVTKAPLTITAGTASKVYGQTLTGATGSTNFTQSGLLTGETIGSVSMNYGTGSAANDAVGTYTGQVVPSLATGGTFSAANYTISYSNNDLTVTAQPITVTADAQSKVYGDADPALTYTVTTGALVGTDRFTGSLTRIAGESVGTYAINQGSLAIGSNYTLTYVGSNLTIAPKAITVTADAQTKIYGDVDPGLTYQITSGTLVGTDNFTGTLSRTTGENVGAYPINQGTLALSTNYALTFAGNNLAITKKSVTVTADAINKNYGDADPTLTYSITAGALVGTDTFTGTLGRTAGETIGAYPINLGTLALNGNYTLNFSANNLTIGVRPITITADAKTKVYGTTDPALTYTITSGSLVNGDTFSGAMNRIAGENVGTYTINQGTVALNSNYQLTYVGDNLTITAKAIAVTADIQTKIYGVTDPTLTYAITSGALVPGDNFTGSMGRQAGENVGTYTINQGTLALNSNYTLTYTGNNFSITKANLTITANNATKTYGTLLSPITGSTAFTSGGLQNGETIGSVSVGYGTGGAATDVVGIYTGSVTASAATGGSFNPSNYNITYSGGDLTVTKGLITITAGNVSKIYGDALSNASGSTAFTSIGLQNGETIGSVSVIYGAGSSAADPVGVYTASVAASLPTGGTFNPANYDVTYVNGNITIGVANVTLTANPATKIYGSTLTAASGSSAFGITAGSMKNGDVIGSVSVNYGTGAAASAAVGTYPGSVTISGATGGSFAASNYNITYAPGDITVTKAPLGITANTAVKVYGTALTGGTSTAFTITSGSLKNGETIGNVTLAYGTGAAVNAGAGTYTGSVTPSAASGGTFNISNYTVSYSAGDIMVTKAALTVTATGVNKVYDGTTAATVTITDNRIAGDNINFAYISTFSDKNVGVNKPVTVSSITAAGPSANNYTVNTTATTTANITAATATVTAATYTKVYDKNVVAIAAPTVAGLMSGDFISAPPSETFNNANAGTGKTLTATGLIINDGNSGNNYTINYITDNTGVITQKTVTVTAQTDSRQYNGTTSSSAVPLTSALLAGDVVTTAATQSFADANVGSGKTLTPAGLVISDGNGGANYAVNYVSNAIGIITPATLTFTATAATKTYGSANPALTGSVTGFLGSDNLSNATNGSVVFTTAATAASPVGNYLVAGGGLSSTNYVFTQAPLNNTALNVTKAAIMVAADNQTKVYGAVNPSFTATYTGFVNGDTKASLTTQPVIITTAAPTSGVGSYPITVSGATSTNYSISYAAGAMTITPATLTVTASNVSRKYGATNPALLVNYTGFVNGDNSANLTSLPSATTTATLTSLPGKYPIAVSGAASNNYTISYTPGTLTITSLTNSTLDNLTVSNGVLSPAFTGAVTSYTVNVGNSVTTETVTPSIGDATATITVNGQPVLSGNQSQSIALVVGLNTINVTVTAQDGITKTTYTITVVRESPLPATVNVAGILPSENTVYGTHSSAASFTVSGSNTLTGLTVTPPAGFEVSVNNSIYSKSIVLGSAGTVNPTLVYIRLAATTQVGTYAGNVTISTTNGSNTIVMPSSKVTPAPLVITADDKSKNPGTTNPYLTVKYQGFVNNDGPSDLLTSATVITTAQTTSPVGTYPIVVSGAESPNYTITYQNGTLTVAAITVNNSFTPNGDGINDTWQIPELKNYAACTVSIFTRAGVRVFYSISYPVAWDGRIDGRDLPAGTYYYVIDLKNGSKPMSGWVAVIR